MKIKLDENIPAELIATLAVFGHDVDTVMSEGLTGNDDATIWQAAQNTERFLITQDMDFSDARTYAPGKHCGLLLLRLRDPSRSRLIARMTHICNQETMSEWERCFVVATDHKIRVRRQAPASR